ASGCRKVEKPNRPFRYISYPPILLFQEILLTQNLSAIEHYPNDSRPNQTAKERIVLELRKLRAPVKHPARGRTCRRIFQHRRFHAFVSRAMMNHRPAVILAALKDVDFVAASRAIEAARSMFSFPSLLSFRL